MASPGSAYPYAGDPLHFPEHLRGEGLRPHAVTVTWLFSSDQPDHFVDITTGLEGKIAVRLARASQTSDLAARAAAWRRRAEETGRRGGLPLAEAFKRAVL